MEVFRTKAAYIRTSVNSETRGIYEMSIVVVETTGFNGAVHAVDKIYAISKALVLLGEYIP